MTKEKVYDNFNLCSAYLDKLNTKQINVLYIAVEVGFVVGIIAETTPLGTQIFL